MRPYILIRRFRLPAFAAIVLLLMTVVARTASAQTTIVVDWSTRTLIASPPEIGRTTSGIVTVRNVNDVLYDYTVDVVAVARPVDDFAAILGTLRVGPAGQPQPGEVCPTTDAREHLKAAAKAIQESPELTPVPNKDGKYPSVPVASTVATWLHAVAPEVAQVRTLEAEIRQHLGACADPIAAQAFLRNEFPPFDGRVTTLEHRIGGPHVIQVPITLRPDTDYTLVVNERINGVATVDGSKTFTFSPASAVLTLSAGFGVTSLEGRSYAARTAPGLKEGDPNRTLLSVEGTGKRPVLAALLNYQIPRASSDDYGLTVSTGPVFAFNSGTSNSSSLGFFAGMSVNLFRRFFLSPGVHIAEFADTPIGFNGNGDAVPANFGDLIPQKKWKTKFAVMLTFRTADLSKVVPKPKTSTAEKPAEKPAGGAAGTDQKKSAGGGTQGGTWQ